MNEPLHPNFVFIFVSVFCVIMAVAIASVSLLGYSPHPQKMDASVVFGFSIVSAMSVIFYFVTFEVKKEVEE